MQIKQRIEEISNSFTSAERNPASAFLADHPLAGLEPICPPTERTRPPDDIRTTFPAKTGQSADCVDRTVNVARADALVETKIGQVSENKWEATRPRIEARDVPQLKYERRDA